jgi:hypothetical protein
LFYWLNISPVFVGTCSICWELKIVHNISGASADSRLSLVM